MAIRLTLSLVNVYRVLEFPGQLKLKSITDPNKGHGGLDSEIYSFIPLFVRLFLFERGFTPPIISRRLLGYSKDSIFAMFKGGPGVKGAFGEWNTQPIILLRSLLGLKRNTILWEALQLILAALDYSKVKFGIKVVESIEGLRLHDKPVIRPLTYLGKLGTKAEAAGKIRVFAMVDAWTQWVLSPFHRSIFDFIRDFKPDGTFDQLKPLSYLKWFKKLFSLDLTAATDRLPIRLQRELFGAIFGHELAGAWALLLTGRTYRLHLDDSFKEISYTVGQPMGALSSWASLAITHHFIVQVAAWRAGFPKWKLYTNYAVLGDDIVIGDEKVMVQYLAILDSLGVEVGIAKSLMSHRGLALEFAKRTIFKNVDVSPVPLKEFYAASRHIGAWIELMKKFEVSFPNMLHAFGVGWKVRSWLNKPLNKLSARLRLLILAVNVPSTEADVTKFFELGTAPVPQFFNDAKAIMEQFVATEVKRLKRNLLVSSNHVRDISVDEWSNRVAQATLTNAYYMGPEVLKKAYDAGLFTPDDIKSRDWLEGPGWLRIKSEVKYPRRLLSDALANVTNLIWHEAKITNIADAQRLLKALQDLPMKEFAVLYMKFLEINREISSRSLHVFSEIRPQQAEISGLLTPIQVRMWKRWSGILQNTQPVVGGTPLRVPRPTGGIS